MVVVTRPVREGGSGGNMVGTRRRRVGGGGGGVGGGGGGDIHLLSLSPLIIAHPRLLSLSLLVVATRSSLPSLSV